MRTQTKSIIYRKPDLGSMDQRITIQEPTITQGDRGGVEMTFSDYTTCWAMVRFPNRQGQEGISADQEVVVTPVEFTIHPRPVKENWRIKMRNGEQDENEYFDIINIKKPYGRFGPMVLIAQKLSSDNG